MKPHARFLLWVAAFAAIFALVPLLNLIVILRSGEFARLDDIVKSLHRTGAIYGSALHDTRRELPVEIVRHRQPEIMALGSSRSLDLRQEYFARPFACACGAMGAIEDAEPYLDILLGIARPRLVLLLLDFWWFTARGLPHRPSTNLDATVEITRAKILRPTGWVREGTITPMDYLRLLGGERDLQGVVRRPKIGVMAIKHGFGTRADGSMLNGRRLVPEGRAYYARAVSQINNAREFVLAPPTGRNTDTRFGPDKVVVPERLAALDRVLAKLEASGAQVVLLLPPVAPPLAKAMAESGRYGFLVDLDRELRSRGREYYNFHDPAPLGSDLCEFADAYHSGNTAFMRILRAMLEKNPASPLAPYVDRARIAEGIAKFSGRTIAGFDADAELPPEIDFLDAGCRRGG